MAVRDAVFIRIMYNPRVVGARAILNNLIARSCDIKHCHSLGVAPSASSTSIDVEPFSSGRRSLNSRNRLLIRKREALSDLRTAFGGVLLTMSFLFIPIFRTYFGHQGCELTRGLIGTATLVKAGRYYRNLFYRYARQWKNGTQEWPCSVDCWLWPALWIIFLLPLVVTQAVYLILNIGMSGNTFVVVLDVFLYENLNFFFVYNASFVCVSRPKCSPLRFVLTSATLSVFQIDNVLPYGSFTHYSGWTKYVYNACCPHYVSFWPLHAV